MAGMKRSLSEVGSRMLERARNLGCDMVLNKGEFNRDLPKIIESVKADSG